jgi:hypothetical protein
MLEWLKTSGPDPEDPMRNPASASALLAELRAADPAKALDELGGWLVSLGEMTDLDERTRSEILSLIQEAGAAHVSALLRDYLANSPDKPVVRESKWKAMLAYATALVDAQCTSADRMLAIAGADPSTSGAAAAAALRGLRACRLLSKVCLIHYADVPPGLWQRAYGVHARAEAAGCAGTAVHPHRSQRTTTTANEELVRLLMLHVIAPETLASEQIEIADRVADQLGAEFTLRPRGLTDSPFWFDGEGGGPPQRATSGPGTGAARYFGPGTGLDALARLSQQLSAAGGPGAHALGKDIPMHAQIAAVEHLLRHWRPEAPPAAPSHSPAQGEVLMLHGFARVCKQLADGDPAAGAARGLALVGEDDMNLEPPEAWVIRDAGGGEIGAELRQAGASWARSGMLVGVSLAGRNAWWLGVIRRMHADPAQSPHVDIALLSKTPVTLLLRPRAASAQGEADWDVSAGTFAFVDVHAILLPEASEATGTPNILLPPEGWKAGRVYEATLDRSQRSLRLVRVLQRGEDFVRAAYEWLPAAA